MPKPLPQAHSAIGGMEERNEQDHSAVEKLAFSPPVPVDSCVGFSLSRASPPSHPERCGAEDDAYGDSDGGSKTMELELEQDIAQALEEDIRRRAKDAYDMTFDREIYVSRRMKEVRTVPVVRSTDRIQN